MKVIQCAPSSPLPPRVVVVCGLISNQILPPHAAQFALKTLRQSVKNIYQNWKFRV